MKLFLLYRNRIVPLRKIQEKKFFNTIVWGGGLLSRRSLRLMYFEWWPSPRHLGPYPVKRLPLHGASTFFEPRYVSEHTSWWILMVMRKF